MVEADRGAALALGDVKNQHAGGGVFPGVVPACHASHGTIICNKHSDCAPPSPPPCFAQPNSNMQAQSKTKNPFSPVDNLDKKLATSARGGTFCDSPKVSLQQNSGGVGGGLKCNNATVGMASADEKA